MLNLDILQAHPSHGCIILKTRMFAPDMSVEIRLVSGSIGTDRALKRFFSRVRSDVDYEMVRSIKAPTTYITCVTGGTGAGF